MRLFLVESPTKAKTIQKYLGKDWKVLASMGHIKDLPEDELGVDLKTLEPRYVFVRGKRKVWDQIKRTAQKCESIYIGTDPDREGEAIAYFLWNLLKPLGKKLYRVRFYEVSKEAITLSVQKPEDSPNMNLVRAQMARRVLDRLIGYLLSPKLWVYLKNNRLSVGRVQSPALRLIVERERQIRQFKRKKFYYIKVVFEKGKHTFHLIWDYRFEKPENAKPYLEKLKSVPFEVERIVRRKVKKEPPKPFHTASLQAVASQKLGVGVDKVQKLAQKLYEEGFITYPRTDSLRMDEKKAQEFMNYIKKTLGEEYVGTLRKFKEKPTSQGAHECIRPVSLDRSPTGGIEEKLFTLIMKRTLASLASPALLEKTDVVVVPLCEPRMEFKGQWQRILFDGWLRIEEEELDLQEPPPLSEGEILLPKKVTLEERRTEPPPRYTEATLVKTLEKLGIGRPSTYAQIVKTLKDRGYVTEEKGVLKPTPLGEQVLDFLEKYYPRLVDYKFTAHMEEELDSVEEGKDWKTAVRYLFRAVAPEEELPPSTS